MDGGLYNFKLVELNRELKVDQAAVAKREREQRAFLRQEKQRSELRRKMELEQARGPTVESEEESELRERMERERAKLRGAREERKRAQRAMRPSHSAGTIRGAFSVSLEPNLDFHVRHQGQQRALLQSVAPHVEWDYLRKGPRFVGSASAADLRRPHTSEHGSRYGSGGGGGGGGGFFLTEPMLSPPPLLTLPPASPGRLLGGKGARSPLSPTRTPKAAALKQHDGVGALTELAPSWWSIPPAVEEEARRFDWRHKKRSGRAERLSKAVDRTGGVRGHPFTTLFSMTEFEVRKNRFVEPYTPPEALNVKRSAGRAKATWDIYKSIWGPRARWCDSKDLYDTPTCARARFDYLWAGAIAIGVNDLIVRFDDGESVDGSDEEGEGEGGGSELAEVEAVFSDFHELVEGIFGYYTALSGNLHALRTKEWSLFIADFDLAQRKSKAMKNADLDLVFITIDSKATKAHKAQEEKKRLSAKEPQRYKRAAGMKQAAKAPGLKRMGTVSDVALAAAEQKQQKQQLPPSEVQVSDSQKALTLEEFLVALLHVAINKYVVTKKLTDVSEALHRFFAHDLKPKAAELEARNAFLRVDSLQTWNDLGCYCEPVDIVLRRHEKALRHIYEEAKTGHQYERGSNAKLLSLGQWHGLLEATELYDPGFSAREGALCFCFSRMMVINSNSDKGRRMESGLPFEGFLEALCRVASLKALPTDEEIEADGQSLYSDAGQFMADFRLTEAYNDLLRERSRDWGDDLAKLCQPLCRCVEHVVCMLVRAVQDKTARRKAGFFELSEKDVQRWATLHLKQEGD